MRTGLVVVSGAPGSGKTTLARRLAGELTMPLLSRDALKEILLDTLGADDRAASQCLGVASYALLAGMLDTLVGTVPGLVVESNFTRGRAEGELAPLVQRADAVFLHCETTREEIVRRIDARSGDGERHSGHFDAVALPDVLDRLAAGAFDPLDLPAPKLRIDTTDGYAPPWSRIVRFVHDARTKSTG